MSKSSVPSNTKVAKIEALRKFLEDNHNKIEACLPKHISGERMARVALNCVTKNTSLLECNRQSFVAALLEASELGLEPGVAGQCWLVPFADKCTLIPGYRGLVQLALRSQSISFIESQVVHDCDDFEFIDHPTSLRHKRCADPPDDAKLIAVYATARHANGHETIVLMYRNEVLKIKAASRSAHRSDSPWKLWESEQWKKTAVKRLCKMLPMSVDSVRPLNRAIELDDQYELGAAQAFDARLPDNLSDEDEVVVRDDNDKE